MITRGDGSIISMSNDHNHLSNIVKLGVQLMEREHVLKALENPNINPRTLVADLSDSLTTTKEKAAFNPENFTRRLKKARHDHPGILTQNEMSCRIYYSSLYYYR